MQRFSKLASDSLIPELAKYENNQFINVYNVFCKKRQKSMKSVYTQGLELQHKMHQIVSFNNCNDDKAVEKGRVQYCQDMFAKQNEFVFWSQAQVRDECQHLGDATCSKMNEALFSKYSDIEKKALDQVVSFTESEIKKKIEKEQKLKQFVEQADDILVPDHDSVAPTPNLATESPE